MEIRKRVLPEEGFSGAAERSLWRECFGGALADEELDTFIFGRERASNTDVLFSAEENGEVLATCHITIDRRTGLGGFGEVAVSSAHRGRGLGRIICRAGLDAFDADGGRAIFLGTGNPTAAALYSTLGFAFLPGSSVMLRCADSQAVFFREYFRGGETKVEPGNPSFRIPVIPLALYRYGLVVLDGNARLFGSDFLAQGSCMSLYPRFEKFIPGDMFLARGAAGEIAGAGTLRRADGRGYADLFSHPGYPDAFAQLVTALRGAAGDEPVWFQAFDEAKRRQLADAGAVRDGEIALELRSGISGTAALYRF